MSTKMQSADFTRLLAARVQGWAKVGQCRSNCRGKRSSSVRGRIHKVNRRQAREGALGHKVNRRQAREGA
ncbi:MAG: hypothetical protein ABF290_07730, partial [Thiogranum sp.]